MALGLLEACGGAPPPPSGPTPEVRLETIPATRFAMGVEDGPEDAPRHMVRLTRQVRLAPTEVSQGLYRQVMGGLPDASEGPAACADVPADDALPVVCVSWEEALRFCNRLSRWHGLEPVYAFDDGRVHWDRDADGFRLPTEAEWELVARGGAKEGWPGMAAPDRACRYGNIADRSLDGVDGAEPDGLTFPCDDGHAGLAPGGTFLANPYGLHDLMGNVWEWVWDAEHAYGEDTRVDPSGPSRGTRRGIRGGSHHSGMARVSPGTRRFLARDARGARVGLRLAQTVPLDPATLTPGEDPAAPTVTPAPPAAGAGAGSAPRIVVGSEGMGVLERAPEGVPIDALRLPPMSDRPLDASAEEAPDRDE